MYKGGPLCKSWLRNETVFVAPNYTQEFVYSVAEKLLVDIRMVIDGNQIGPLCDNILKGAVCKYFFPHCTEMNPGQIDRAVMCYESCAKLVQDCGKSLLHLISVATVKYPSLWKGFKPLHIKLSDLSCLRDHLPSASSSGVSCLVLVETKQMKICEGTSNDTHCFPVDKSSESGNAVAIAVSIPFVCLSLLVMFILACFIWKKRLKNTVAQDQSLYTEMVGRRVSQTKKILWEDDIATLILESFIDGKRLKVSKQIGEGNFGRVFKGVLDAKTTVAIKSLKSAAGKQGVVDNETANSFVREALRMRHFDHPHVMKLIGICWAMEANFLSVDLFQLASGPLILLPYTELGDLRGYLRDKRRYSLSSGNPYVIISNISTDTNDKEDECLIPVGQLVKFGYQIAIGMEYVSKQGIVHRDLATRNCMLTWDMNIKVSDFGLARMLEEGKDYYRMGQGSALPIRWMAPESIADLLFTTESDVVSYIWHFSHNAHVLIYLFGYLCRLVSIWYSLTGVWAWRHLISLPPNLN
jgi:hypothetical protein